MFFKFVVFPFCSFLDKGDNVLEGGRNSGDTTPKINVRGSLKVEIRDPHEFPIGIALHKMFLKFVFFSSLFYSYKYI